MAYGVAWGVVGAAMGCYHEALSYGMERVMFDGPIAGKQIQQVRLADMVTDSEWKLPAGVGGGGRGAAFLRGQLSPTNKKGRAALPLYLW